MKHDILKLQQKVINNTILSVIFIFFATFLFYKPFAWGFVFGACFGLINFNIRCKSLKDTQIGKQFFSYIFRYTLSGFSILIAFYYAEIDIIANIMGLLLINIWLVGISLYYDNNI